jgi:hypothetical protein
VLLCLPPRAEQCRGRQGAGGWWRHWSRRQRQRRGRVQRWSAIGRRERAWRRRRSRSVVWEWQGSEEVSWCGPSFLRHDRRSIGPQAQARGVRMGWMPTSYHYR